MKRLTVDQCKGSGTLTMHSSKILTIQQGQPRGVSSVGNPRQASIGFNSGSLMAEISTPPRTIGILLERLAMAQLIYQHSISHKECAKVHFKNEYSRHVEN